MVMEKNFDVESVEMCIVVEWVVMDVFVVGVNVKLGVDSFLVVILLLNVIGSLYIGYVLNNILQDIFVCWYWMCGFDMLWQFGQDYVGIVIQMVVECCMVECQELGCCQIGCEVFLQKVWVWKQEFGDMIIGQLKCLGVSCDWLCNVFIMFGVLGVFVGEEGNFYDVVIKVFVDMYDKGLIYCGKCLVNWDLYFEIVIFDFEVESCEIFGYMWYFKYLLVGGESYEYVECDEDGNVILCEICDYISIVMIWFEIMLGDGVVVVYFDDVCYVFIVGKLVEILVGFKEYCRLILIIIDEYFDLYFGLGVVKIIGVYDFNDYGVVMCNGILFYVLLDIKGVLCVDGLFYVESVVIVSCVVVGEDVGDVLNVNFVFEDLCGFDCYDVCKIVIEVIMVEGLVVIYLYKEIDKEIGVEYMECWFVVDVKLIMQFFGDCFGVVIELMLIDQWFVDMVKIVGLVLEVVCLGKICILLEQYEKVYFYWLENIEFWIILCQLWWGYQILVWYDDEGNQYCVVNEVVV